LSEGRAKERKKERKNERKKQVDCIGVHIFSEIFFGLCLLLPFSVVFMVLCVS
jgi:hypothetical protein